MKFDADKGDTGFVHDAEGNLLERPISGDTETGLVVCFRINELGEFVRRDIQYKAPLRVSPLKELESDSPLIVGGEL